MNNINTYLQNQIKNHILTSLINHQPLKYSEIYKELKENNIDNVLFNYHLQHLVKNGLIENINGDYSLTIEGRRETAHIISDGHYFPKFIARFRIYILDFENSTVLYQKWNREPWKGDYSAISSKVVWGVESNERVEKRIFDKTNLKAQANTIGTYRKIIKNEQDEILDDTLYFIAYSKKFSGELKEKEMNGDNLIWLSFDEAVEAEKNNRNRGEYQIEILKRLTSKNFDPIFYDETINLNKF